MTRAKKEELFIHIKQECMDDMGYMKKIWRTIPLNQK